MWEWVSGCSVPVEDEVEHSALAAPPAPPDAPPAPAPECGEPLHTVVVDGDLEMASAHGTQGGPWFLGVVPGRSGAVLRDAAGDELLSLSGLGASMVVAFGSDGRPRWTRVVSGTVSAVAASGDGVVALGEWTGEVFVEDGRSAPVTRFAPTAEVFVARWDAQGELGWLWTAQGGLLGARVAAAADGAVALAGVPSYGLVVDGRTVWEAFVLELDPAGTLRWVEDWGTTGSASQVAALAIDPDTGDAVLAGSFQGGRLPGADGLDRQGRFVAWLRDGDVLRTVATGPSQVTSLAARDGAVAVGGWTMGGPLLGALGQMHRGSFVGELGADGAPRWAWGVDGDPPSVAADAGGLEFVAEHVSRLALDTPSQTQGTGSGVTVGRVGSSGALRCAGPPVGEPAYGSWMVRGAPLVVATWQADALWVRGW